MPAWKSRRKVLLGITGGISAYKGPDLLRALMKAGCEVEVVLTEEAERFVSPLVLSTLAGRRIWQQRDFLSDDRGWEIPHITLADWADVVLIAPCTAETMANAAAGRGKDLLGSLLLAARSSVVLFPAMNVNMLAHPATARNREILHEMGYILAEPDTGSLACGYEGKGRLPSVEAILDEMWRALCPDRRLEGRNVLVTAGPTREFIDPVRFIGNPSTGKMGWAMARSAWYRGASVTLVLGPVPPLDVHGFTVISVVSAEEMKDEVLSRAESMDVIVKSAAVGDFRSASFSRDKIKRGDREELQIDLVQNPDIASLLGERKRPGQILVGFAAESSDLLENAVAKMKKKNLDFIVANDITAPDSGFAGDTNRVKILGKEGVSGEISGTKEDVAEDLWCRILDEAPLS